MSLHNFRGMDNLEEFKSLRRALVRNDISVIESLTKTHPNIINFLIGRNIITTLMIAFNTDHTPGKQIVHLLIKRGIDVNCLSSIYINDNCELKTPLMIEALFHNEINVNILLKNGADVHIRDKTGKTVLEQLIEKKDLNHVMSAKIIKMIKRKKSKDYYKFKRILYKASPCINDDCIRHISSFIH